MKDTMDAWLGVLMNCHSCWFCHCHLVQDFAQWCRTPLCPCVCLQPISPGKTCKLFFAQAPAEGTAEARPAGKDAFAVLMQQARQEQGKQCSSSGSTAEKAQAQAPTDALSFLMQQARGAQQSTASAPSVSRCGGNLVITVVVAAIVPLLTVSLWACLCA